MKLLKLKQRFTFQQDGDPELTARASMGRPSQSPYPKLYRNHMFHSLCRCLSPVATNLRNPLVHMHGRREKATSKLYSFFVFFISSRKSPDSDLSSHLVERFLDIYSHLIVIHIRLKRPSDLSSVKGCYIN